VVIALEIIADSTAPADVSAQTPFEASKSARETVPELSDKHYPRSSPGVGAMPLMRGPFAKQPNVFGQPVNSAAWKCSVLRISFLFGRWNGR